MSATDETAVEEEQTVFGANVRRPIHFVRAGQNVAAGSVPQPSQSLGDKYLSIVLKDRAAGDADDVEYIDRRDQLAVKMPAKTSLICNICDQPIDVHETPERVSSAKTHDISLAHQVCVQHSYPPSEIDRKRAGLRYLSSYGWNVDGRVGLGVSGEGRRAPVRAHLKNDTVGLGMKVPKDVRKVQQPQLLDAGKIRKKDDQDRKRRAKLHEMFYRDQDVENILGS